MNILFQRNHQRVFGTWPLRGESVATALEAALHVGYRHFDTAQKYQNEADVGLALANCGVPREELCVTTKVMPSNFKEDRFLPSVENSLKHLHLSAVDLLLLHWPPYDGSDIVPSLKLLARAHELGLARNIGVSNYTAALLHRAATASDVPLVTNQVEFHPLLNQDILLSAAAATGVPLSAYCSVARGEVFRHPEFAAIGAGYDKTAGQVVLRWILQKGVAAITMSTKPANIKANYEIMDFTLSSVDMAKIDALTQTGFRVVTKNIVPGAPDWD